MSSSTLAHAAGLGAIAGLRSMTAPALLSRRLRRRRLWHRLRSRSALVLLLATRPAGTALTVLAAGELVADKLPFVPARTEFPSLVGRAGRPRPWAPPTSPTACANGRARPPASPIPCSPSPKTPSP